MFKGPAFDIGSEGIVKALLAQYLLAQYRQPQSRLFISGKTQVVCLYHIREHS